MLALTLLDSVVVGAGCLLAGSIFKLLLSSVSDCCHYSRGNRRNARSFYAEISVDAVICGR